MVDLKELPGCTKCGLCEGRTHVVVGKGSMDAKILFIGEAPGAKEDEAGIPFVGAAGKELSKLLDGIGLTPDDVYITNIVKCRPPGNRDPTMGEIMTCSPYLVEQICTIRPSIICTLGNYSTKFILAQCEPSGMKHIKGITQLHGRKHRVRFRDMEFTVVPLYHPAAMLYNPGLRTVQEGDFGVLKEILETEGHGPEKVQHSLGEFF